jgi:Family of unknown function (DUF6392)
MNGEELTSAIWALGQLQDDALKSLNLVSEAVEKAYSEADTYYIRPEKGLYFVFDDESRRLAAINLSLSQRIVANDLYEGELPLSLNAQMKRGEIQAILGTPDDLQAPGHRPLIGNTGGWDKFRVKSHPGVQCIVGYDPDLNIDGLQFEMITNDLT